MSGIITFHFDGPIAENHEISLRNLANTLNGFQGAIDRAHLDLRYGNVWKYARLKQDDYEHVEFIVGTPREGGYILDLTRGAGAAIVKRIYQAIDSVTSTSWDEGADETEALVAQVVRRQQQLNNGTYPGRTLDQYKADPGEMALRKFGDRSIAKEIDQVLTPIRRSSDDDDVNGAKNSLEIEFDFGGRQRHKFLFKQKSAEKFHKIVSQRALGEPLLYSGVLRALDRGTRYSHPKAKLTLTQSKRDIVVHIGTPTAYQVLAPHMQGEHEIQFYACPILEFNTFDPNAGDVYFVALVD